LRRKRTRRAANFKEARLTVSPSDALDHAIDGGANELGWTGEIASHSALLWGADAPVISLPIPVQFCSHRIKPELLCVEVREQNLLPQNREFILREA